MSTPTFPKPTLHHVTLKSTRIDAMVRWYTLAVGMDVNHHSHFGAWLSNDAANHRIALLAHPALSDDPDKIPHTGMHHMAFEFADLAALLANFERLRRYGVVPRACLDHGMTISMYYVDPDGNGVELQADTFGDWDASSEWMRTASEFQTNPIGVSFDPTQMLNAFNAGIDPQELHRRAYAGKFDPGTKLDLLLPPDPA